MRWFWLVVFGVWLIVVGEVKAADISIPVDELPTDRLTPRSLVESKNADLVESKHADPVATWEVSFSIGGDLLQAINVDNRSQVINNTTQPFQGNTLFQVVNPSSTRVIAVPDRSGEISLLGQEISGLEIVNDAVELGVHTVGNFLGGLLGGNGLSILGEEGEGWVPSLGLGDLSENWVQSSGYDIVLDNVDSEIKILGSDGDNYAILDAGELVEDVTLSLVGGSGTLLTDVNYSSLIGSLGEGLQAVNNLTDLDDVSAARVNLGLGSVATTAASDYLSVTNNLSDLGDVSSARSSLGLGSIATEASGSFLSVLNNLSELGDVGEARTNLGLGSVATTDASDYLSVLNNLSDLNDSTTARSNLGLGSIATSAVSDFLQVTNDLSDLDDVSLARMNLGLGSIATEASGSFLSVLNNLSELGDVGEARTNLGLGSVATTASGDYLLVANNLSDLGDASSARSSLGLGSIAVNSASDYLQVSNNLSDLGDASSARSSLGLGSIAVQDFDDLSVTGATLSGITNFTQASGNFLMLGTGTFSTGTGDVSLNGDTDVVSGRSLEVVDSDGLSVGGVIIPQKLLFKVDLLSSLADSTIFVADDDYQLDSVRCVYSGISLGGSLQVTVDTGTSSPGSGTDQLQSAIDLTGSANTVLSGTLIGSPTTISTGDRLSIDLSGSLLGLLGSCTVSVVRV